MKYLSFETFPALREVTEECTRTAFTVTAITCNIFNVYSNLLWYNLSKIYAKFSTRAEPSPVQDKMSEYCGGI